MAVYLDVIEGPLKGKSFAIQKGYKIGRRDADILLDDSKVSGSHAQIEDDGAGGFILSDLGSANGIRCDGRKVDVVYLNSGSQFQIGRSHFEVRIDRESEEAEPPPQTWRDLLLSRLQDSIEQIQAESKINKLLPFVPALELKFIQGIQADETVVIGYGPRVAGLDSSDVSLWEPGCPEVCFKLQPQPDHSAVLVTDFPNFVKINGNSAREHQLKKGDIITMGYTHIKVDFVGESR